MTEQAARSRDVWRVLRLAMAVAIVLALATQFFIGTGIATFRAANFFSYFTVLSNVGAAAVLMILVLNPVADSRRRTTWRGAATLYMAVTGIVYVTILLPLETDVGVSEPWIDWIIHGIGPLFVVVDWMVNPATDRVDRRSLLSWLAFPAAYLTYTLIRGPLADWYPYPFLDPRSPSSYGEVAVGSLVVLVTIVAIGFALIWSARISRRKS